MIRPTLALLVMLESLGLGQSRPILFQDDFESGLGRWDTLGGRAIRIEDTGDPGHGRALYLEPNGDAYALMRGSDRWQAVRFEGDVMFPSNEDNYFGVISQFTRRRSRTDFNLVYVKGNDNYVQVNPHRDFNVSRTLYPELRVALEGAGRVSPGRWLRFVLEVDGADSHFYLGDLDTPVVTYSGHEFGSGALGVQPRSVGASVWIDNVAVSRITRFRYRGPNRPGSLPHDPQPLLTSWQVAGPFPSTRDDLARDPRRSERVWQPFTTDRRGAVITGRIVDYHGPAGVAYFRSTIRAEAARRATVWFSTVDDLAIWANGRFLGFAAREPLAWFDLAVNPAHRGPRATFQLEPGLNDVVVRVRGGVYASGGFFAWLEPASSR